jgi:hypothetical protein
MPPAAEPAAARRAAWAALAGWLGDGQPANATASDWQAVADLAMDLRLGPLLYHLWREAGVTLPAAVDERLEGAELLSSFVALLARQALAEVIQAFDTAGIRAVVLKGFAIAEAVYPDAASRPMADQDLLVRRGDVARAAECLERLGYRPQAEHNPAFDRRFGGEITFVRANEAGPPVELHWDLLNSEWPRRAMHIPAELWWQRAVPLAVGPVQTWRLAPDDTLIYLAIHLAIHHYYDGTLMFLDLDRLIRGGPALDWGAIVRDATAYRVRHCLYFALAFTRRLFDTPVPEAVLDALRPAAAIRRAVEGLVDPLAGPYGRPRLGPEARRILLFLLVDRWQDRLREIGRVFFPGRAWIAAHYEAEGPPRSVLYTAWHALRVAGWALAAAGQVVGHRFADKKPVAMSF